MHRPPPEELDPATHRRELKRRNVPGQHRFLTLSCFSERPYFKSERTRDWGLELLARAQEKHQFRLRAFVIMPEHVHLLLMPTISPVSRILYTFKKGVSNKVLTWCEEHAPEFLQKMQDVSPQGKTSYRFWERGGGYDRNIWSKESFWKVFRYIHFNPVERGLCARPSDWKWSSAGAWAGLPSIVTIDKDDLPDPIDKWYS